MPAINFGSGTSTATSYTPYTPRVTKEGKMLVYGSFPDVKYMVRVEPAIRERHCSCCGEPIAPKTWHLRLYVIHRTSEEGVTKNICQECATLDIQGHNAKHKGNIFEQLIDKEKA